MPGCVRAQKEHVYGSGEHACMYDDDIHVYEMRADRPGTSPKAEEDAVIFILYRKTVYMKSKTKPEIMAPVGGEEQLKAAVRLGADAVYFGMQKFNARRNADNFAGEGLADTIKYCHSHGVKVYLTVNTLVMDDEIDALHDAVDTAAMAGADAIIVQDLAVARYAHEVWPQLPLHASTQMAVCNVNGVKELLDYGFTRVVVARELSLTEIRKIIDETDAEIEVFVHGAHCMSVSGNCYLSAMIGGRSGNRGLCAQPCRLDWELDGKDHALSLKDLSYIKHLKKLCDAGVSAVKIEGRMKRAEYVAAAVTACRDAMEGRKPDLETLQAVFSRSGFTDGYLTAKRGPEMFGYRTKEDVVAAKDVLDNLAKLYEKEPQTVSVDMLLYAQEGEPSQLTVSDYNGNIITVTGNEPQKAINRPITEDYARRSLEKTGGTMYKLERLDCALADGIMLPASALNEMRRNALDQLTEFRTNTPVYQKQDRRAVPLPYSEGPASYGLPTYRYRFENATQIFDDIEDDAVVILPIEEIEGNPTLLERFGANLAAEMPSVVYPASEEPLAKRLAALKKQGLTKAVAGNISTIRIARNAGLEVLGGMCLNILNSVSLEEYRKLGLTDAMVSFELSFARVRKLTSAIPFGLVCYGYLPLMKLRSCPKRGSNGCAGCTGLNYLTDRMGERFPLICRRKEYSELLNCVPIYVGDKSIPRCAYKLLYFTIETPAECRRIAAMFKSGQTPDFRRTGGLYFRDIQ